MISITEQTKAKMQAALDHFKTELKTCAPTAPIPACSMASWLRSMAPRCASKNLPTSHVPEPRQLLISPFDPQTAGAIAKGIEKANLNLQPIVEGQTIRINVPPMDEAMRKQIVKQGKKKQRMQKLPSAIYAEKTTNWRASKRPMG